MTSANHVADATPAPVRTLTPERAFLLVGLLFGTVFVFLTPPFQVPDEPEHFFRAFQVSELPLLARDALQAERWRRSPHRTNLLPKSLRQLVRSSDVLNTQFRPLNKVTPAKFLAGLRDPLRPEDRVALSVTPYPAISYVPQAVGIGLGRLAGGSALVLFYLGRFAALAAWAALVFHAIRITPIAKWPFFLLALMPMTLTLAGSHSADSVVIAVSLLLTAQILSWAYDAAKPRVTRRDLLLMLGLALALSVSKPPYLLLLLLVFLVPGGRFGGQGRRLAALVAILLACAAAHALASFLTSWATLAGPLPDPLTRAGGLTPLPDVAPSRQIAHILAEPVAFLGTLANTLASLHGFYLTSFVGVLGWLDTPLPAWLPYAYIATMLAVLALDGGARVRWTARGLALAVFVLVGVVMLTAIYVAFSSVGMGIVYGFQGRYLIPAAPALFIVFHGRRARWPGATLLAAILIAFVSVTTAVAGYRVVHRFYVAEIPTYSIDALIASPAGDIVVIKGWAVDRTSGGPAGGVAVELDGQYYMTRYGLDRADVARRWKKPEYRYSGFEVKIAIPRPGRHLLALRVLAQDGTWYVVPEEKLPLMLSPAPRP